MKEIILASVGEIASGKGVFVDYLKQKFSANSYKFSTPLRDVLDRLFLGQSRENMQNLSFILRNQFGQDVLAKVIADDVKNDEGGVVLVDGVRRVADIKYLKELENFYLVHITADPQIRYERVVSRAENPGDKRKTFEEFLEDEKVETELTIKEVIKQADFTVENNGTLEEFYERIDELLEKFKMQD